MFSETDIEYMELLPPIESLTMLFDGQDAGLRHVDPVKFNESVERQSDKWREPSLERGLNG